MNYKIGVDLRVSVRRIITRNTSSKILINIVGCNLLELKEHLQKMFYDRGNGEIMTWNNNSFYGWHIDHIKPVFMFDLTDEEHRKECFHYTNMQPLWAEDNFEKGRKYEEGDK